MVVNIVSTNTLLLYYYYYLHLHFPQTWIFSCSSVLYCARGKQVFLLRVLWAVRGWTVRGRRGRTRK